MTNIVHDITHIPIPCELCGLPLPAARKTYHADCKRELVNLKDRMRRRQDKDHDEITHRFNIVESEIEWLLSQSSGKLRSRVGDIGQSALLAFRIQIKRPD